MPDDALNTPNFADHGPLLIAAQGHFAPPALLLLRGNEARRPTPGNVYTMQSMRKQTVEISGCLK